MTPDELERRFTYHPPSGEAKGLHEAVREMTKEVAADIALGLLPGRESREMSLFWTHFEQATFWLHAHIARNEHHFKEKK